MRRLAFLWGAAMVACGGAQVETVEETPLAPPTASAAGTSSSATSASVDPGPSPSASAMPPEGAILRADLRQLLARGPAGVLAMVRTEPARSGGRFVGFRIRAFAVESPEVVDLRVGDVVMAVNGQPIVSPDDFFRVFQELEVASELRFDILREGKKECLVYPIVDAAQ
jgi:type II secretory pathway component PulC